ncbi:MAG: LuxR C-terminal-related transcriptional regulator [Betaproteobacteria bacterium]
MNDAILLTTEQAQQLVRTVETAGAVQSRKQFFVWVQMQLLGLIPHELLICGAYRRRSLGVVFDTFQYIVISPELLGLIADPSGGLTRVISDAWVAGDGKPLRAKLADLKGDALPGVQALQRELGYRELLVHGVARPERPQEIESLFIFGGPVEAEGSDRRLICLDLVLPHLHRVWQRVIAFEQEFLKPAARVTVPTQAIHEVFRPVANALTAREVQVLEYVREGSSNQQVAAALTISPLTVKNHIQKILRKLGASNRAQAVARAMSLGLLDAQLVQQLRPYPED